MSAWQIWLQYLTKNIAFVNLAHTQDFYHSGLEFKGKKNELCTSF